MSRGKLFSIKSRISSINNIFDLSKAMSLVSSSKFNSLQYSLENAFNYGKELENIIFKIASVNKEKSNSIFIIVASDKGLCGSYNNNIIRFFKEYLKGRKENFSKNKLLVVGKKILPFLRKNFEIDSSYSSLENTFELSLKISNKILIDIDKDSQVFIFYTNYRMSRVDIRVESLLLTLKKDNDEEHLFEPHKQEMFKRIFPMYLRFKIYRSILSSLVSEHYSRMLAMKNASDNAEDLIKNLKRFYNKERQSIITQEILEVVSGSESFDEI